MDMFEYFFGPNDARIVRRVGTTTNNLEIPCVKSEQKETNHFEIKCVLSNREKGVFTVKWTDGTVTMVTCQPGDDWDDEKALAMCFMKKALGNKGAFNDVMREALDKMTIIPEKKKIIPAVEVAPVQTRAEVDFDETMKKLKASAIEAGKNMKESISRLLNENTKKDEKPNQERVEKHTYSVYLRTLTTDIPAGHFGDKDATKEFIKKLAYEQLGEKPYYYRVWEDCGRLHIDFGSHTRFIEVEGMTSQEWIND